MWTATAFRGGRSLARTRRGPSTARVFEHNEQALYTERAEDYVKNLDRLARKFDTAKTLVPKPVLDAPRGATVGIIAFGSSDSAVVECRDQLTGEAHVVTAYHRLRAYPFTADVEAFVRRYDRIYVVEQNRDAQMLSLLRMDLDPALAVKMRSVRHYSGLPIDARSITEGILSFEREGRESSKGQEEKARS